MKRLVAILLLLGLAVSAVSCGEAIELRGVENYIPSTCSFGLTSNLFPSEDIISMFGFEEGDYAYYDSGDRNHGYAKAFAYFRYPKDEYEVIKSQSLNTVPLMSKQYEYNGYVFSEYLCYSGTDENGVLAPQSLFPQQFNMVGYNDEERILVFIGYFNGDPESSERALAQTDFGAFLNAAYSEYYNFDK